MKYGSVTLGQVEAVWNKLGGEDGVRRFLVGETLVKVAERVFSPWKTIKLGTHKDAKSLQSAIEDAGIKVSDLARDIMFKPKFTLASEKTTIELVTATVAELGFSGNTRYDKICARIQEFGYEFCPAEVGPQLRLQYPDQSRGEWLYMAMEPITGSDGRLRLFNVEHGSHDRWLNSLYGSPDNVWDPDYRFVFVCSK